MTKDIHNHNGYVHISLEKLQDFIDGLAESFDIISKMIDDCDNADEAVKIADVGASIGELLYIFRSLKDIHSKIAE